MRKRTIQIPLRLSEKEYTHLQKQVDNSCLDREKYLRALIMGNRVHPQPCEAYIEIQRLLSSVSNNINQIARIANQTGCISENDTYYVKLWRKSYGKCSRSLIRRAYMNQKKFSVQEENQFVLGNRMMASEVKLGRTVFDITSKMTNEANSFKDIVRKVTERELRRLDKDAG